MDARALFRAPIFRSRAAGRTFILHLLPRCCEFLARGLDIRRATRGARDRESILNRLSFPLDSADQSIGSLSGIRSDAAFSMESESEPFLPRRDKCRPQRCTIFLAGVERVKVHRPSWIVYNALFSSLVVLRAHEQHTPTPSRAIISPF